MRPAEFPPQSIWDQTVSAPASWPINPVKARFRLQGRGADRHGAETGADQGRDRAGPGPLYSVDCALR